MSIGYITYSNVFGNLYNRPTEVEIFTAGVGVPPSTVPTGTPTIGICAASTPNLSFTAIQVGITGVWARI